MVAVAALLIPRMPFQRLVRQVCLNVPDLGSMNFKWQTAAIAALHVS